MNRIRELIEPFEEERPYGDFWVVSGPFGAVCVTADTARDLERQLDRRWRPTWLRFEDRVGSRVRVRACDVRAIVESTAAQRAADRTLERRRRLEEERDRPPWERDG